MSDKERLEVIKKNHEFGKGEEWEFTVLTDDIDWLIQQAEKVQELQKLRKIVAEAHQYNLRKAAEENARLRETLEFYADHSNWHEENTGSPYLPYYESDASRDGGDKARNALGDPE